MFDHFVIMTFGGVSLFSWNSTMKSFSSSSSSSQNKKNHKSHHQHAPSSSSSSAADMLRVNACHQAIDSLISNVLIEDRSNAKKEHIVNESKVKWLPSVETQLIFVVVFQRFLQFSHLDAFLREVRGVFETEYANKLCPKAKGNPRGASAIYSQVDFHSVFDSNFNQILDKYDKLENYSSSSSSSSSAATTSYEFGGQDGDEENENEENDIDDDESQPPPSSSSSGTLPPGTKREQLQQQQQASPSSKRDKIIAKMHGGGGGSSSSSSVTAAAGGGNNNNNDNNNKNRTKKEARQWTKEGIALSSKEATRIQQEREELLAKSSKAGSEQIEEAAQIARGKYIKVDAKTGKEARVQENDWSEQVQERGQFANWFRGVVGNCELDMSDLDKILPKLRDKLISKNVAVDVSDRICESLKTSLRGKKIGTFESMDKIVEGALIDSLRRIMRPKKEINILRDVETAKTQRRKPYTIVFCGVNGVGKSTSLSKVAFWLQQNGYSILIAAGDTFRHGAVEQLQVHGKCLGAKIFQLGYGTDPTLVTKQAVQFAATNKIDVVLVDTAGRMQDHESRMQALARLIGDNNPDLVLFVGEALVGNNGIDQLKKFNQCLLDYAALSTNPRGIDGIVLTKFDTIDDKVGAAVSMVYQLGQPIVFVGVGQTYQDLKSIEPDVVVECLMK